MKKLIGLIGKRVHLQDEKTFIVELIITPDTDEN